MTLTRTGRVQWASSWSNAQRRDTISQPASLPIAKASTPPRSFSHAFTARFVGPSMNGSPRKPGCARPRCPRDHLAQADRHIAEASPELCPQCRATKITRGICIIPLPIAARVMPIAQFLDTPSRSRSLAWLLLRSTSRFRRRPLFCPAASPSAAKALVLLLRRHRPRSRRAEGICRRGRGRDFAFAL